MGKIEKISVIISTYNRFQFLKKAISSVQAQTHKNLEIIVSDDGSTDKTETIVKNLQKKDERIIYLKNKHRGLPSATRNRGIEEATGRWIAFLDDDDIFYKDKLKKQLLVAIQNNFDLVSTNANIADRKKTYFPLKTSFVLNFDKLIKDNKIITSSVLLKKNILNKVVFSEKEKFKAIEDYDLWLKLASLNFNIGYINEPLIEYKDHPQNSIRKNSISYEKMMKIILKSQLIFNLKKNNIRNLIIILMKYLKLIFYK